MQKSTRFLILAIFVAALTLGALPALAQGGPMLNMGVPISGEISSETPEVLYTFQGRAGETITVSMTAAMQGLDSYVYLRFPDGTELFDDDSGGNLNSLLGPVQLPVDGTYTVVATRFGGIDGNSTGLYTLLVDIAQIKPLDLNETLTFELNDEEPVQYFTYPGGMNQAFSLTAQGQGGNTEFNLIVRDPNGNWVNNVWGSAAGQAIIDPLVMDIAGNYTITVTRQTYNMPSDAAVSVRIGMTLRAVESRSLAIGETITGTLDDNTPSAHYTFQAQAGDVLRLSGAETAGGQPFEVQVMYGSTYLPYGAGTAYAQQPGTFFIDPLPIDNTGSYQVILRRTDMDGSGPSGVSQYTLTLGPTETPLLVSGQAVTGTFSMEDYSEQVYRFDGVAGQTVRMTLRTVEGSYAPAVNWQGPSVPVGPMNSGVGGGGYPGGSFIADVNASQPGTAIYETTLPVNGTYLFRVRNGGYGMMEGGSGTSVFSLMVEVTG